MLLGPGYTFFDRTPDLDLAAYLNEGHFFSWRKPTHRYKIGAEGTTDVLNETIREDLLQHYERLHDFTRRDLNKSLGINVSRSARSFTPSSPGDERFLKMRNFSEFGLVAALLYEHAVRMRLAEAGIDMAGYRGMFVVHDEGEDLRVYQESGFESRKTLEQLQGRLATAPLLRVFSGLIAYATAVNELGLIDFDLKPANVFSNFAGTLGHIDQEYVFSKEQYVALVAGKSIALGTAGFLTPERYRGRYDEIGTADMVHSLCNTFLTVALGCNPLVNSSSRREIARDIAYNERPEAGELTWPQLMPYEIKRLALRGVSLDPQRRPSLEELAVVVGSVTHK